MKKIIIFIYIIVCAMITNANDKCTKCNNKGYFEDWFICPLCQGYFFISPGWFDLDIGNTRWTETTYWTGLQTKSDVRKKMFSFKKCPMCENSMKKGALKYFYICSCKNKIKMIKYVQDARKELKKMCKNVGISDISGADEINDWLALNAPKFLKKSTAKGKILRKLIWETINAKWDRESINYKRDESKYKNRVYIRHEDEEKIDQDDYVIWIDDEKNTKAREKNKD